MRLLRSCPLCGGEDLRPFTADPVRPGALHVSQARCRGCGLVIAQPMATEEDLIAFYAGTYYETHPLDAETHFQENVRDYPRYELPLMERLAKGFWPGPGASVGEIGCGHGSLLHLLRERGYRVRGVEVSTSAVAFCRAKGLDVREARDFGDEEGTCDVAASLQVIEHVIDPRAFVRKMVRLARPGGAVVIATENLWTAQFAFARAVALARGRSAPYRSSDQHTYVFQGAHLERLLREEGCSEARSAAFERLPPRGNLHFRLYREAFRAADRAFGSGEYLMAVGRRA